MQEQADLFGHKGTAPAADRRPYQWSPSTAPDRWHGVSAHELRQALERASAYPDADLAEIHAGAVLVRRGMTFRRTPTAAEEADAKRQGSLL